MELGVILAPVDVFKNCTLGIITKLVPVMVILPPLAAVIEVGVNDEIECKSAPILVLDKLIFALAFIFAFVIAPFSILAEVIESSLKFAVTIEPSSKALY